MKTVVQVKLLPTPEQARALEATLHACNRAANEASRVVQARGLQHKYALHHAVYQRIKAEFGLSAQPAARVIGKVADAYTTRQAHLKAGKLGRPGAPRRRRIESTPIDFRPDAAQPFDDRCLSWQMDARTVSIWTVQGRMKHLALTGSPEQLKLLADHRQGESDLIRRNGMWFLAATCEVPEQPLNTVPDGFVGVDLGIVEIATTSDGNRYAGRVLNRYRRRQNRLRAKLQKKNSKSAKRLLKRRSRREARRARDINHQISKRIVERAERTDRGIALEDLRGIRGRVRLARAQRSTLHSWSFAQLRNFISYKARRSGVPVQMVDPAYSSQTCSECDHTSRLNRSGRGRFVCRSCGVVLHADVNASRNLARSGEVAWNAGRQSVASDPL
ncbi:IS200/IS605 family element transposase accessory protein TnpB [Nocardiopsis sp. HNM0947]|uniref:IS200/IS605 family element transposase accessory protein TnpB n=1 Tax=Nocardiopsis coralli TaxID=2772213 RepID=A0ABR9P858_9ACTN|nr:RNA-guided endonuclease TnpB family protein [Nocardiopsis coralli]MBE3000025.1 IS200/IS605 family element transposase accessory protein TnpB [Nocardiopsis coralli]